MDIGESITIGRMGQQPLHIADTTVDPQHALRKRQYQILSKSSITTPLKEYMCLGLE